jgi:hypothetical protein
MTYKELQAKRASLQQNVKVQEELVKTEWNEFLGSKQPVVMLMNVLSSTFSRAKSNPYVSIIQAAVFVYQDFKEKKLPTSDRLFDYFVLMFERLKNKSDNS